MDGMRGWLVDAGHPDPSLARFSVVKTFDRLLYIKPVLRWPVIGTKGVGTRYGFLEANCQILVLILGT